MAEFFFPVSIKRIYLTQFSGLHTEQKQCINLIALVWIQYQCWYQCYRCLDISTSNTNTQLKFSKA